MQQDRRQFLQAAGLTGLAVLLPIQKLLADSTELMESSDGFVVNPEDREVLYIAGRQAPLTIFVDRKRKGVKPVSLCREEIAPASRIPVHKHLNEEELIFIQQGSGLFTLGEKEYPVGEGSAAFVPRGVWHGLQNNGTETLKMVFSYAPSGFEAYFREIGVPKGVAWKEKTKEEYAVINQKYGIVYR